MKEDEKTHRPTNIVNSKGSNHQNDNTLPMSSDATLGWSFIFGNEELISNLEQQVLPDIMRIYDKLTNTNQEHVENDDEKVKQISNNPPSTEETSNIPQIPQFQSHQQHQVHHTKAPMQRQENISQSSEMYYNQELSGPAFHSQDYRYTHQTSSLQGQESEDPINFYSNMGPSSQTRKSTQDEYNSNVVVSPLFDSRKRNTSSNTSLESFSAREGQSVRAPPTKSRKKGVSDSRWSKRFRWPDDLHGSFVSAIFEVGLKHATTSSLLEYTKSSMSSTCGSKEEEAVDLDQIKKYLQKYRQSRPKSQYDFMESVIKQKITFAYETGKKSNLPIAGATAAYLSHEIMSSEGVGDQMKELSYHASTTRPQEEGVVHNSVIDQPINLDSVITSDGYLMLPQLTDAEKRTPIGVSLGYFLGIFLSLRSQIWAEQKQPSVTEPSHRNTHYHETAPGSGGKDDSNDSIPQGRRPHNSSSLPNPPKEYCGP